MKRFWQLTVAIVLGVATLNVGSAQQNGNQGAPRAVRPSPFQQPPAQQAPRNQQPAKPPIRFIEQQFAPRVPAGQNQPQQDPNNGVLQAQGVNRFPGQQGVGQGQPNNQQQFLGSNVQPAAPINPNNQLDEFGANLNQANQVIAAENARLNPNSTNGLMNGTPSPVADQVVGSGPGFTPANLTSSYGGTSSYEEGILSGEGRYAQGSGEYNRNTAEAVKTLEQARTLAIENARARLKTYFELKDLNAKYRASRTPYPISKEKLDEWNRQDQPNRLTKREFNSDTGRIQWPAVLTSSAFTNERLEVEALFARRSANEYGPQSDFYRMVNQETTMMQTMLKAYLKSEDKFFTDEEYIIAKNFLSSLAHEARIAPDLDGLVAN